MVLEFLHFQGGGFHHQTVDQESFPVKYLDTVSAGILPNGGQKAALTRFDGPIVSDGPGALQELPGR